MSVEKRFDSYFEDSKKSAYLGHETWWNAAQMKIKMHLQTAILCWFLHSTAFGLLIIVFGGRPTRMLAAYIVTSILHAHLPSLSVLGEWWAGVHWRVIAIVIITSPIWLLYPRMIAFFQRRAEHQAEPKWIRGSKLITPTELNEQIKQRGEEIRLSIGTITMPTRAETSHVLICGTTGAGKTVLLQNVIDDVIRDTNARGIILDVKGDMIPYYYNPERDLLLNPADARTIGLNPFQQIELVSDIDTIAAALIPEGHGKDSFFNSAARDVFISILHYLWSQNRRTNADIWKMITMPTPDLAKILANTPGGERGSAVLGKGDNPQGEGVKATLMIYTACFALMQGIQDSDFNISRWLTSEKGGWIFVSNFARISENIKPWLCLVLDLFSRALLSLPEDRNRRVYMILDELSSLPRLGSLPQLLALARSKGGSVWIGTQSISQFRSRYGENDTDTIVNNCATSCTFRLEDPQSMKYFADKAGSQDVEEMDRSLSIGVEDGRDGETLMPRRYTRQIIMPSEFSTLPERHLYLRLPGYDMTKTEVQWRDREATQPAFVLRPDLNMSSIEEVNIAMASAYKVEISQEKEVRSKRIQQILETEILGLYDENTNQEGVSDVISQQIRIG